MSHTATCDLYEHVHEGVESSEHDRGHGQPAPGAVLVLAVHDQVPGDDRDVGLQHEEHAVEEDLAGLLAAVQQITEKYRGLLELNCTREAELTQSPAETPLARQSEIR